MVHFGCARQRAAVERAALGGGADRYVDGRGEIVGHELAHVRAGDTTCRVDQYQRRPCADCILIPDHEVVVYHHGVANAVAQHRRPHVRGSVFGGELRGMNADHHKRIAIACHQLVQLRDVMVAIDAAKRPEFKHDDPAAQIGKP